MSEPFVGEIKMFAGNFAPRGFSLCDGQLLSVSQNDALFSLLGTIYGGDGRTTFGLPDMRGRLPIHFGSGPGLSPRNIGWKGGSEEVTLTTPQLPAHSHGFSASTDSADSKNPRDRIPAMRSEPGYGPAASTTTMHSNSLDPTGGGGAHSNLMPFQCVNFIIALIGIYPSRN
jgi:microcystin-dependent protein